jgi:hypothetical protein
VRGDLGILAVFSLGIFVLLLSRRAAVGDLRDELYYVACANRLAWGYVDHPPLSIGLLAAVRATLATRCSPCACRRRSPARHRLSAPA